MLTQKDAETTLRGVKKLLDESNEIVDEIRTLKNDRAQLQPLCGSLRRRSIRCGKQNCRCRRGQLHGPYHYFAPSKCRGKWQYVGAKLQRSFQASELTSRANHTRAQLAYQLEMAIDNRPRNDSCISSIRHELH